MVLTCEQGRLNTGKDFPKNSYFFSSIYLDMMRNKNVSARNNYVITNLIAAGGARYIHFLICHLSHWTLVVYDTEIKSWKHYNSIQNRNGMDGSHITEASFFKNIVTKVQRQLLASSGLGDMVGTQDFDMALESIVDYP